MKYKLVADSSCDMFAKELITKDIDFEVVPLTISVAEKNYVDVEELDTKILMEEILKCKDAPKSACPSPEAFADAMEGADNVICVTISSKLSGTYNSARLGADLILEKEPNKNIFVLDSGSTSSAMCLLLEKAKELIERKAYSFEEIKKKLIEYKKSIKTRFMSLDLSTLIKAGRMSKIAGLISKALSIVPVCGDNGEGEIKVYSKCIGVKRALSTMSDYPKEKSELIGKNFPVIICHNHNIEDASSLKKILINKLGLTNIKIKLTRGLAGMYVNYRGIIMSF